MILLDSITSRIPAGIRRLGRIRKPERPTTLYLPQHSHLPRPYAHMIRHMDGPVFAMWSVRGIATDDMGQAALAGQHERLCSLYRQLAMRGRLTLVQYLVRTEVEDADLARFPAGDDLARRIEAGYRRRLIGDGQLWINSLFLGALIRPATLYNSIEPGDTPSDVALEDVQELEQVIGTIEADLGADYGLRRLALRQEGRLLFSEPAEALALVLSGRRKRVPLCRGRLGRAICPHRMVFRDDRVVELHGPGRTDYCSLHGLSVYPAQTDAAIFDHMLAAPYRFALAQSIGMMPLHKSQGLVSRSTNQFISANDPAVTQKAQLAEAADELQQRQYALGVHNITLAAFADDEAALDRVSALADDDLRASGAIISRIDWDLEAAYCGVVPGTEGLHCRAAPVKTRNFAAFGAMHNFAQGWRSGRWCDHVALFATNGGTPFYWNPHVDSEGDPGESPHLLITGPNRSGKTTVLLTLVANVIARAGATVVLFDKDRGCKLAVMRMGGRYFEFRIGEDTWLAPLRALDPMNPGDMDFLFHLVCALILSDGGPPLTDTDQKRIALALRTVMAMPPHLRSFGEVRAFLGVGEGSAAERLRRWCAGHELGWVVDCAEDRIALDGSINAFDQTYYLDHSLACGPIQSYLFRRVAKLADGRRLVVSIDEAWKSARNDKFRDLIFDGLRTWPKQNAAVWLSTQSISNMLCIPGLGDTLRTECLSAMFFADGAASWKDFGPEGLNITERAYSWITRGLMGGGKGRFLLRQGTKYTPCQLSLEGDALEEVRAELSGRTETVNLMDRLVAEMGDEDRDALFAEFHHRRKSHGFQRASRRREVEDASA